MIGRRTFDLPRGTLGIFTTSFEFQSFAGAAKQTTTAKQALTAYSVGLSHWKDAVAADTWYLRLPFDARLSTPRGCMETV
jgi:hypothetical protein